MISIIESFNLNQKLINLTNSFDLIKRVHSGSKCLIDLYQSIESEMESSLSNQFWTKLHSIKNLVRASQEPTQFREFLNCWIQILARFIQCKHNQGLDQAKIVEKLKCVKNKHEINEEINIFFNFKNR